MQVKWSPTGMSWKLNETVYVECLENTYYLGEDGGSEHGMFFFSLSEFLD